MPKPDPITAAARTLGRLGGSTTTPAKAEAARANGAKGGRPRAPSRILTADRAGAPNIRRDEAGRWTEEAGGTWRRTSLRSLRNRYGDAWPELRADDARKAAARVHRDMIRKRRGGGWVRGGGVL